MTRHSRATSCPHHHHHNPPPSPPHPPLHQVQTGFAFPFCVTSFVRTKTVGQPWLNVAVRAAAQEVPPFDASARADGSRDGRGRGGAPLLTRTEACHSHQGGGGAQVRSATATEVSSTGRTAGHPRGARAAEERPQPPALLRSCLPTLSLLVGRGNGRSLASLPRGHGAAMPGEGAREGVVPDGQEEEEEEEEEVEGSEILFLTLLSWCSRLSHVEAWTLFPWPLLGSTMDANSYVSLSGSALST